MHGGIAMGKSTKVKPADALVVKAVFEIAAPPVFLNRKVGADFTSAPT
jgi:hypothetical protein